MPGYIEFEKKPDGVYIDKNFIENIMPEANGTYVKIYLYALMRAESRETCTIAEIAGIMGILESDVSKAFEYWAGRGLMDVSDEKVIFTQPGAMKAVKQDERGTRGVTSVKDMNVRPDPGAAADALASDDKLAEMCDMVQQFAGRTFSSQETATLYWFYDTLGLDAETIVRLFEYCIERGKNNMRYIEKVAIGWHENGIKTLDQAEEHIKKENEKGGYLNAMRRIMRISDRAFSHSEEEYLYRWRDDYGMDADMVALAYEYCIIQTSKLSFPYMEKILQRWHESGIKNTEQARQDNDKFKSGAASQNRNAAQSVSYSDKTDHEEMEKLFWNSIGKNKKG